MRQIVHLEYGSEIAFYVLQMVGLRQFCINPACLQFLTSVPNNERCRDRIHFAESSRHYEASAVTSQGTITRKIVSWNSCWWRGSLSMSPCSSPRGCAGSLEYLPTRISAEDPSRRSLWYLEREPYISCARMGWSLNRDRNSILDRKVENHQETIGFIR